MKKLILILPAIFILCCSKENETPQPKKITITYEIYNSKANFQFQYNNGTWQTENITQQNYSKTVECSESDFQDFSQAITQTSVGKDSVSMTVTMGTKHFFVQQAKNGNGTIRVMCNINDLK